MKVLLSRHNVFMTATVLILAVLVSGWSGAAEELTNDSRYTAVAVRVTFMSNVRITDYGDEFAIVAPSSGLSNVFVFSGGVVRRNRTFEVEWSPNIRIKSIEWLQEEDLIPPAPQMDISMSRRHGDAPLVVAFDAVIQNVSPSTAQLSWNLGDGTTAVGEHVDHTYTSMGVYRVELTASTEGSNPLVLTAFVVVSPLYVDPGSPASADASGSGSETNPFKTIAGAVAHSEHGQAVLVAPGVYNAASGEPDRIEIPDGVCLVGGGDSADDVKLITTLILHTGSGLVKLHMYGTAYTEGSNVFIDECQFTGSGEGMSRGDGIYAEADATITNCTISNYNEAVIAWGGHVLVQDCQISGSLWGVAANTRSEVEVRGCTITDCYNGVVALHGGYVSVSSCVIDKNNVGISSHGDPGSRSMVELCRISNNTVGISLEHPCQLDLGGGQFGSSGGNVFEQNDQYNLHDSRPPYSGPIYAIGNSWVSYGSSEGSIQGPATGYNQEKCYIEGEGNSIILSN